MENTVILSPPKTRDIRYDLLRIFAAFMVVVLHVSGKNWSSTPPDTISWAAMNLYDSFVRSAVPLFFMLSGAFMLKKEANFKKLYGKIFSLALIYTVWSVLYAVDTIGLTEIFNTSLLDFAKAVVKSKFHLWFIPSLIGAYILQPIMYAIVHFENGKYTPYYLICFLIFGIIQPTLSTTLNGIELLPSIINKLSIEMTGVSGYMILGYYIVNQKPIKIKKTTAVFCFMGVALISTIICQLHALKTNKVSNILYGNFMLPVCLEAILIFAFFQSLGLNSFKKEKINKIIQKISALTMGVYLFHPFVIEQIGLKLGIDSLSFNPIVSIPVLSVAIFAISLFVSFIMTKIPIIKIFWKL